MRPSIYPDFGWSTGAGRLARTLRVVLIAVAVGAVGGGAGALAAFGTAGNSPSQHSRIRISTPRASVQLSAVTTPLGQPDGPARRANSASAAAPAITLALAESVPPVPSAPARGQAHGRHIRPSAVQDFYDQVEPSSSAGAVKQETLGRSIPLPLPAPARTERSGKRRDRARIADVAPGGSALPSRSSARAPMSILPGRQPAFGRDRRGGWRAAGAGADADRRRGRPGMFGRDQGRKDRGNGGALFDSF